MSPGRLQAQITALQQYTDKLQSDFEYNLTLLDQRDADLLQADQERGALQQRVKNLEQNEAALSQKLAVCNQGHTQ